jgi:hypothetical protein
VQRPLLVGAVAAFSASSAKGPDQAALRAAQLAFRFVNRHNKVIAIGAQVLFREFGCAVSVLGYMVDNRREFGRGAFQ